MGIFSRKPPLPNVSDLSAKERIEVAPWAEAMPSDAEVLLAVNADNGQILRIGGESVTSIFVGVVLVGRSGVHYLFEEGRSVRSVSRSLREIQALTENRGGEFQISFFAPHTRPNDFWFVPADHEVLLAAFREVWSQTGIAGGPPAVGARPR